MMGYQSCIDWCHNHPVLLTILLILSILFPLILCATTCTRVNAKFDLLNPIDFDLEKQQISRQTGSHLPREPGPALTRLYALLYLSRHNSDDYDAHDTEGNIEPQEKTPLIGSVEGDEVWRRGGQLGINWHGINQLNTSWSYMT